MTFVLHFAILRKEQRRHGPHRSGPWPADTSVHGFKDRSEWIADDDVNAYLIEVLDKAVEILGE